VAVRLDCTDPVALWSRRALRDQDTRGVGEYVGKLFDGARHHPQISRIVACDRLENSGAEPHPAVIAATTKKIAASRYAARQLLLLVQGISSIWSSLLHDVANQLAGATDHARRRQTIVDAVRDLVTDRPW